VAYEARLVAETNKNVRTISNNASPRLFAALLCHPKYRRPTTVNTGNVPKRQIDDQHQIDDQYQDEDSRAIASPPPFLWPQIYRPKTRQTRREIKRGKKSPERENTKRDDTPETNPQHRTKHPTSRTCYFLSCLPACSFFTCLALCSVRCVLALPLPTTGHLLSAGG